MSQSPGILINMTSEAQALTHRTQMLTEEPGNLPVYTLLWADALTGGFENCC